MRDPRENPRIAAEDEVPYGLRHREIGHLRATLPAADEPEPAPAPRMLPMLPPGDMPVPLAKWDTLDRRTRRALLREHDRQARKRGRK